jgi:hypothetical protein
MTVQNLYTQYLDGKVTKQKFLYEVRRDQNLTMISPTNSFDDVIKILKNKSIISEKASKESKQSTGKQDVEIISKTIDMVNPYEYARGMDYELDIIDVPATSGDLHTDNVLRAQKKVLANLTKNPQYYFEKLYGKDKFDGDETVEINKKSTDAIGKGKKNIIREGLEGNSITKEDIADELSNRGYSEDEINQYIDSLERSDDKLRKKTPTKPGYHADGTPKSNEEMSDDEREAFYNDSDFINESYNPFPISEEQEAVLQKYAEATGISVDNLKNMVAEAKAKKKASKPDFLDLDKDGDKEESMKKAAQDKKQAMSENEAFENDNEPHELHILLAQLAKSAIQLAQDLKALEMEGIDNLPQWFQAKIIIAKSYIQGAKEYLEGEMNNGLDEEVTSKTNDSSHNAAILQQINKVPNSGAKAELTKAFNSGQAINI